MDYKVGEYYSCSHVYYGDGKTVTTSQYSRKTDKSNLFYRLVSETGFLVKDKKPDGSLVIQISIVASDEKYFRYDTGSKYGTQYYPWYSFDNGSTKTKLTDLSHVGDRHNNDYGFLFDQLITVPAGTEKITIGGYLDIDMDCTISNSKKEIGKDDNGPTSTDFYKICVYGRTVPDGTDKMVSVIHPYYNDGATRLYTISKSKAPNLGPDFLFPLFCKDVDSAAYSILSAYPNNDGSYEDRENCKKTYGSHTYYACTLSEEEEENRNYGEVVKFCGCDGWAELRNQNDTSHSNSYEYSPNVQADCYCYISVEISYRNFYWVWGTVDSQLKKVDLKSLKIYNKYSDGDVDLMSEAPELNSYNTQACPFWKESDNQDYTVSGCTFTPKGGSSQSISISNGEIFTDYGTYTLTVSTSFKGDEGNSESESVVFEVKDNEPPKKPNIIDAVRPNEIIYDTMNRVYTGSCYPTLEEFEDGVEYETKLIFYPFTDNKGHLGSSTTIDSFELGSELNESGKYKLKVTAKKGSNGKEASDSTIFSIDNMPPDPPIINVSGTDYTGINGEVGKFPQPVPVRIKVDEGCTYSQEVWFKKRKKTKWIKIDPKKVYEIKGYYKVRAVSIKTRNKMESDPSEVMFQRKIKYDWIITLDPNKPCYRTRASVNFDSVQDISLKRMYKINDGEWKWYLGPVFIYENCTFYAKSLDGDDDYPSNIASKVIDIVDDSTPNIPNINIPNGATGTKFVPKIIS